MIALHLAVAASTVRGTHADPEQVPMTTSAQQTVLTGDEISCLRDVARGMPRLADDPMVRALVAKGMLDADDADDANRHTLTPAGRHAVDVAGPGMVPGIDE